MKNKVLKILLIGMFLHFAFHSIAQVQVRGTVVDSSGDFLPGVSIQIKGTSQGVVTDMDGNYSLSVPDEMSVLIFSFVGMETREINVNGRSVIDVTMNPTSIGMDEVVVTALGISREKKSLGYSVSEIDGQSIEKVAQENVLNSLSGKLAGVAINATGGAGSSVSMVIRGASSLTSDNQPLFVIDGVPVNNTLNNVQSIGDRNTVDYGNAISDLNTENIESVSVLKGPSAAALYGSRAGNGVVLITTKSGKESEGLGVTLTSNTVFETPYKFIETHSMMANGQRPFTQDNRPNNGLPYYVVPAGDSYWVGPELDKGMMAYQWPYFNENGELTATEMVSHPDNTKNFFQTGMTTTNGFAITNANEKVNYRLSYNNMQNQGLVPNSDLHKNSISLNSTLNLAENFSVSSSINFTSSGADNRTSNNRGANPLSALYRTVNPHIDINDLKDYWEPGQEGLQQRGPYTLVVNADGTYRRQDPEDNPYFLAHEVNNGFRRDRVYGHGKFDWQLSNDFSLMGRYTHDQFHEKRETKIAPSYTRDANGVYGLTNLYRREQNVDFLLSFDKILADFSISASVGGNYMYQYAENNQTKTKNRGSGLIVPGIYNVSNIAPDNLDYNSGWSQKGIYSLYGLTSFGYKDAVYLDLTARNDWSSTLPVENRSYFYPSASLSLLLNNMADMGENVSLAKLRAGWAMVGNDTDPYKLMTTMGNQGAWGNQTRLTTSGTLLLPDLKPEIQTSWEVGADLAFFDNRLRLDGTYYQSENENQILGIGLPPSSGYNSKQINAGLISSKGIEFSLGGTPLKNADWNWDVNFVFSRNRTKIEELAEGFDYIVLWTDAKGGAVTRVGDEIGQIVDDVLVRVDDPNSEYHGWPIIDSQGWENSEPWENYMEKGDDTAVIGNFNPDFLIGMQTSLSYKKWSLNASFDWRIGGQFISQTYRYMESDMLTERWIDRTIKINDMSGSEMARYLKENPDKYLSPDGEFFVLVGGPTSETGGLPHTEDGITLNDGVFMPGVEGYYDDNGNFVAVRENLGDEGTPTIRFQDYYGWSYSRTALFDSDFIKLREISLTYQLPAIQSVGIQSSSISLYSRNLILWTKADVNIDPEMAFQPEGGTQGSGIQFKQGIERFNVNPWTIPVGIRLNVNF
ncbi:TonB-linked outer membrane protein, SusC/RagA family [Tangfeifania diversioriginum]|uniref:TonB-linked outer membrane protein, SusC/RagA family n=1 Tax=Tangfeifania diversioriginum TaxID=1168035 RepID=A0A1M6GCG0_9BACT|nr:SusC/RagA family TonB-linked outer membrane protein [Tangfeifania diversioriginum]SHJ07635.1 TonB-linked outer membrane protein, SusC/RagA family [Tangfeifania diversioriginum]